jgi:hypothetical protein
MKRLTTVRDSIEANFLQHKLAFNNIESFVTNEHTGSLMPHLYGMLGHGIQVMVSDDDYEKAKEILLISQQENEMRQCPHCGSTNVGYGIKGKNRMGDKILIFISLILTVPMGNIRNKYYCKDCEEDFV